MLVIAEHTAKHVFLVHPPWSGSSDMDKRSARCKSKQRMCQLTTLLNAPFRAILKEESLAVMSYRAFYVEFADYSISNGSDASSSASLSLLRSTVSKALLKSTLRVRLPLSLARSCETLVPV